MNLIKTTLCNRLTNDSLNAIRLSPQSFHDEHLEKSVNYLFNTKSCCLSQCKSKKTKPPRFNISDISSESESSTDSSALEEGIIS